VSSGRPFELYRPLTTPLTFLLHPLRPTFKTTPRGHLKHSADQPRCHFSSVPQRLLAVLPSSPCVPWPAPQSTPACLTKNELFGLTQATHCPPVRNFLSPILRNSVISYTYPRVFIWRSVSPPRPLCVQTRINNKKVAPRYDLAFLCPNYSSVCTSVLFSPPSLAQ